MTDELPQLPPTSWVDVPHYTYTAQQMRAYAAQAVAQAIEACAKLCEAPGMVEDRDGLEEAARRIRATLPRTTAPQE